MGTVKALGIALCLMAGAIHAEEAVVALVLDLSGPNATQGAEMMRAADQAVEEIAAEGGLLGRSVKLELDDIGLEPARARSVAKRLSHARPAAVVGDPSSDQVIEDSPVYAEDGILQISAGATNPRVTEQGISTLFRTIGRDDAQGRFAGDAILRNWPKAKIAVIHDDGIYARELAQATLDTLKAGGLTPITIEAFEGNTADFAAPIARVMSKHADLVYAVGVLATDMGILVRQLRDQGFKGIIIGSDVLANDEFTEFASPFADGVLFTSTTPIAPNSPLARKIAASGGKPNIYALNTYMAIRIWADAVRLAGSFDTAKVAAAMHGHGFETVLGKVSFDAKGDIVGAATGWRLYAWHGDRIEPWKP